MKELAYLAMLGFPVAAVVLFSRLSLQAALMWTLAVGFLYLPQNTSLDLPLLPALDRTNVPLFMALILCIVVARGRGWKRESGDQAAFLKSWLPASKIGLLLIAGLLLSPVLTVLTNRDPVVAPLAIRGMSLRDFGAIFYDTLAIVLTMLMARRYLSNDEGQKTILIVLALAGLTYAPFVMFEWRMSPQLHATLYGFNTFEWSMAKRFGGFRPVVFQRNGLITAILMAACFVCAIAAVRHFTRDRKVLWRMGTGILAVSVVMLNSFGAWILAAVCGVAALFLRRTMQLAIAASVAVLVLIYPMTQAAKVFPNETVVSAAAALSPSRSRSLEFRLKEERKMIEHTESRRFFGWGIWGRGVVFDERGRRASTTDSLWILVYSEFGLLGYLSTFGLMCVPLILVFLKRRRLQVDYVTSGLCLVQCVFLVDQLVNDTVNPFMWLIAGSLLGRIERKTLLERPAAGQIEGTSSESLLGTARRSAPRSERRDHAVTAMGGRRRAS